MPRAFLPRALALIALCASGCLMTQGDGDELREEAKARDLRIQQLEAESRKSREEIDAKLRELQEVLDQATAVLKRGSADVGAQVEQMREQVARLEGESAELKHKLEALDQQFMAQRTQLDAQLAQIKPGAKEALDPAQIPADKQAHYQAAYAAYQSADYDTARALWKEYVTRYPKDAKAGDAQYWIGATYTQQSKPATALGEYRKVIAEHSKSNAVNVALYGMADAFYRLHACTDARNALQALIKRKPEAALNSRAKKLLKDLEKPPKGFCTS
jgi:TolA-binding protein